MPERDRIPPTIVIYTTLVKCNRLIRKEKDILTKNEPAAPAKRYGTRPGKCDPIAFVKDIPSWRAIYQLNIEAITQIITLKAFVEYLQRK